MGRLRHSCLQLALAAGHCVERIIQRRQLGERDAASTRKLGTQISKKTSCNEPGPHASNTGVCPLCMRSRTTRAHYSA